MRSNAKFILKLNILGLYYITLFKFITMFFGTYNILQNISSFRLNVVNIPHTIVSPTYHGYGS